MTPFIAQIQAFGFNFPPRGWTFCNGQLLAISQWTAVFSLVGTTFGGDGRTTFGIPDLRGRSIVHPGQGPGLSTITWGERSGVESLSLSVLNLPAHNHPGTVQLGAGVGNSATGANSNLAANTVADTIYNTGGFSGTMAAGNVAIGNTGGSQPIGSRNPYLGIFFSFALQGIFPSRN